MGEAQRVTVGHSPIGAHWHRYRDRNGRGIQVGDLLKGSEGSLWRVEMVGLNILARLICRHSETALDAWWLTIQQCGRIEVV